MIGILTEAVVKGNNEILKFPKEAFSFICGDFGENDREKVVEIISFAVKNVLKNIDTYKQ